MATVKNRTMKKKTIFSFLLLLAALSGCKDDITLPDADNNPKLVVYCFPSTQDTTWISVSQSIPVKQYRDSVRLRTIDNATISYSVNGGQKSVTNAGNGYYYVVAGQKAGDNIAVTVAADGMPTASAETHIPDTVAIANPNHRTVNIYDDDEGRTEEYDQLMASFTDPAATRDYYAVRLKLKYVNGYGYAYYGSEGDYVNFNTEQNWEQLKAMTNGDTGQPVYDPIVVFRTDSTYFYPNINTKNEPLLMSKTDIDDAFGFSDDYFGGLYIFDDTAVSGKHYTLHLNRYDNEWRMGYLIFEERVELLHLTPEYYNFLKSVNAIENSDLAHYGLSQLMPTASNVRGGLGVVGGWNVSHTEWINAHRYNYEK